MPTPNETPDAQRLQMRKTPAGKFLWELGRDYYDTETSARRVAEHAAERIAELQAELARCRDSNIKLGKELSSTKPNETPANHGCTLDRCRGMAQDAKNARESGSLRPMAEFDPERILWLVEQVEHVTRRKS